jgi:glucosamine-6-phosphate deaminase
VTNPRTTRSFQKDKLQVEICGTVEEMGRAAADLVEERLGAAIGARGRANLILATGASQLTFLAELSQRAVEWPRVRVFHLDEYTELPEDHPASFRRYLKERILDVVQPGHVHLINATSDDLAAEIDRYESLLKDYPIDVACIGIGENGHIAFNDPPVADFEDPRWVKEVELDDACRMQQVNEGWFPSFETTPPRAVTLTIPAIMSSSTISCVVPGERKIDAVRTTLNGPVTTACPASIIRNHQDATLFLDSASAAGI